MLAGGLLLAAGPMVAATGAASAQAGGAVTDYATYPAALPADTDQEKAALAAIKTFQTTGNGYFVEQSTRPQTIGYAFPILPYYALATTAAVLVTIRHHANIARLLRGQEKKT